MKRVTYMSSFSRPIPDEEIAGIGAYASVRNAGDGITGVLLTLGAVFFQIIEGDDRAIDDLYARVLRDDRHTDIICLRTELDAAQRMFPDWSMNVIDLDHVGGEVIEPLKLLLGRMGEAQLIIERYTQPAVSRIMTQGLNPLEVPLEKVTRLVMFTDMVGFSAISARLPIESVSELVTAYLEACSTGIAMHGGEVTKYLGDGVMAYFDPAGIDDALQSTVDMQLELKRIREEAPSGSALSLLFSGFGLALGPVIEGSMGSSVKMDYTIIGEPVNTAARLEALTRTLDTPVLMTAEVAAAAGRDWDIRLVGAYDINSGDPIRVHSLATGATDVASMRSTIATYLDAVTDSQS
ncbi:MAG: BLUF domain-containing protein [Actinomycetota bacterium]|nr:BLUF domain-containing protein [Actinomycetota bacterium]